MSDISMSPPLGWLVDQLKGDIGDAFGEAFQQLKTAESVAVTIGLGVMSAVTQHLADIEFNGGILPCSVNVNVIAERAQGKSVTIKLLGGPLQDDSNACQTDFEKKMEEIKPRHSKWKAVEAALLRRLKAEVFNGKSKQNTERELDLHQMNPIELPRNQRFTHNRITKAALKKRYNVPDVALALIVEEAALMFESELMDEDMNSMIDGTDVPAENAHAAQNIVRPRLSLTLAVQNERFAEILQKRRGPIVASGLTARLLHTSPDYIVPDGLIDLTPGPKVTIFHIRMKELIEIAHDGRPRRRLRLSNAAQSLCMTYSYGISELRHPGELLSGIPDFAGRMIQHTVRLAGVLHVWLGEGDEISADLIERAYNLIRFYAHQYNRIFAQSGPMYDLNLALRDAEKFLRDKYRAGKYTVKWTEILKGAREPRTAARYRPAIQVMVQRGFLFQHWTPGTVKPDGTAKVTEQFQLSPYFADPNPAHSRVPETARQFSSWYFRPLRTYT